MFEILATIAGLVQGVLAYLNKRSSWLVYALQALFLIIFSFQQHLFGDALQNVLFMAYCAYGFLMWGREKYSKITVLDRKWRVICIAAACVLSTAIWLFLRNTSDPLPLLDSATTATTIVASVLLLFRKLETWVVWLVNDILYMVQYWMLPDKAVYLFGLYVVWTVLAIISLINWNKIYKSYAYEI